MSGESERAKKSTAGDEDDKMEIPFSPYSFMSAGELHFRFTRTLAEHFREANGDLHRMAESLLRELHAAGAITDEERRRLRAVARALNAVLSAGHRSETIRKVRREYETLLGARMVNPVAVGIASVVMSSLENPVGFELPIGDDDDDDDDGGGPPPGRGHEPAGSTIFWDFIGSIAGSLLGWLFGGLGGAIFGGIVGAIVGSVVDAVT